MELNAGNLSEYLLENTDFINRHEPIEVIELTRDNDPDADGYVNFLFRVKQGKKKYIVKQSRTYLKTSGIASELSVKRNYLEYISYTLRESIVKDYVPKVFHLDRENGLFIMEDLSDLRVMRFQLCQGKTFNMFSRQIGEFLAKSHFYTSELYLAKDVFNDLNRNFLMPDMRQIMEDVVLLRGALEGSGRNPSSLLYKMSEEIWNNPETKLEVLEVRDVFMKKWECLIHGDLHTSNIFINPNKMYVIDMEYSFMGPFGYDLGYLLANFVSQYSAYTFNANMVKGKRSQMQDYMINTIGNVFREYFSVFRECFQKDGKPLYVGTKGYIDRLFENILQDAVGFMAVANLTRTISLFEFPDFDCLEDEEMILLSKGLSVSIDEFLLFNRKSFKTPEEVVQGIVKIKEQYVSNTIEII